MHQTETLLRSSVYKSIESMLIPRDTILRTYYNHSTSEIPTKTQNWPICLDSPKLHHSVLEIVYCQLVPRSSEVDRNEHHSPQVQSGSTLFHLPLVHQHCKVLNQTWQRMQLQQGAEQEGT